jgi:hypothetical protein
MISAVLVAHRWSDTSQLTSQQAFCRPATVKMGAYPEVKYDWFRRYGSHRDVPERRDTPASVC